MSGGREGSRICIFMLAFCHRQTSPPVRCQLHCSLLGRRGERGNGGRCSHTDAAAPPLARENKLELSVP